MKNTNLIAFQGESPLFRETETSNFKNVTQRTFTDMRDFDPVQNLKFALEKAAPYFEKIAEKKDSIKLKKTILDITAEHLDFNKKETVVPSTDLNQKIKSSYKKLKPKNK